MARADDDLPPAPDEHELDDADRALITRLRALPDEGTEPDWRALEAQIRAQVAPLATPMPWWRNWRWLVPIGALATTAAIVLVLASRPHGDAGVAATEHAARRDASVSPEPTEPEATGTDDVAARAPAMWLDGEAVDLDEIDEDELEVDPALDAELPAAEEAPGETIGGMLPAPDDRWVDSLDDDAADRLETFLARKRT